MNIKINVEGKYLRTAKVKKVRVAKFPVLERLSRKIHNKILSQ